MEEQQRYERPVGDPLQAFDPEQQEGSGRRKPALVRYAAHRALLLCYYKQNEGLWRLFY